jgi:hypothetical protein
VHEPHELGHSADGEEPTTRLPDLAMLREMLTRIDQRLDPAEKAIQDFGDKFDPVWRRVSKGEPRLAATMAIVVIMVLQLSLAENLSAGPRWLLPVLEGMLLIGLVAANPTRLDKRSPMLRSVSICLIAIITAANGWSAGHLVRGLIRGTIGKEPVPLLLTGGSVWLTNVIVFGLWYWDLDRGGPAARAHAVRQYPDFVFPQMQSPELAPPDWAPMFMDYLYLSFTNATAFSPTDVLPLARWAKLTMAIQSGISLITVALVIARAVNILQ